MVRETRLQKIITHLEGYYGVEHKDWHLDLFSLLVNVVLSQHTNDINSGLAFSRLQEAIDPLTPFTITKASPSTIEKAIRTAGLWRIKTKRVKEIAEVVINRYHGVLDAVLEGESSLEEVRNTFLSLPGVGKKTADILLLFKGGYPVFPLDTHCLRLAVRLGFVKTSKDYDKVRLTLEKELPQNIEILKRGHLILIKHGRLICKASNPGCSECPISHLCPYPQK